MAEAHGKMTGKPAVCFVTRGPGATNASLGVHIAYQDSTPMVLMIGQVQRAFLDREAFQEVDFRTMFRPLTKWTAQVEDPDRISRIRKSCMAYCSIWTSRSSGLGISRRCLIRRNAD